MRHESITWQKLRDEIPEGFTEEEQARFAIACDRLEQRLGSSLFRPEHPIGEWIYDRSALSRRRFIRLEEMLERTAGAPGYAEMCAKLSQLKEVRKTLDLLEWWDGLLAQGCQVGFEPPLPHRHGAADLQIYSPQECYVELSEIEVSNPRRDSWITRNLLFDLILGMAPPLCFAGKLSRGLGPSDRQILAEDVLALRRIAEQGRVATIEQPNALTLGLAPASLQDQLQEWAINNDLEIGHIVGPPLPHLEPGRIRRKIQEKATKQLPFGVPGLLVLYSYEVFLQDAHLLETLRFLEEEVRKWQQLSALAVTSLYFVNKGEPLLTATHEGHRIITRENGWHRQCSLLVYNPNSTCKLSPELRRCVEDKLRNVIDYSEPVRASRTESGDFAKP